MKNFARNNVTRGMTLVEILVVIALIALLATIGMNSLGGILGTSKKRLAKSFLKGDMRTALMMYYTDNDFKNVAPPNMKALSNYFDDDDGPRDPWGARWNGNGLNDEFDVGTGEDGKAGSNENKLKAEYTFNDGRIRLALTDNGNLVTD